jgi:hypothetical protein
VVPETSAIKGRKRIDGRGVFTFSSPSPGATFERSIDHGPWKPCTSPLVVKTKKLAMGPHVLRVRAVLAGVADPTPSVKRFVVVP